MSKVCVLFLYNDLDLNDNMYKLRAFKPSGHFRVTWFNQCGPNHFIYTINQMCRCMQTYSGILLEEVKQYQQIIIKRKRLRVRSRNYKRLASLHHSLSR